MRNASPRERQAELLPILHMRNIKARRIRRAINWLKLDTSYWQTKEGIVYTHWARNYRAAKRLLRNLHVPPATVLANMIATHQRYNVQ